MLLRVDARAFRAHTPRRTCRDRPTPPAPRLAPRSTPPGCSPSSTAEPRARRGSSPSDSAVPAPQVRFSQKPETTALSASRRSRARARRGSTSRASRRASVSRHAARRAHRVSRASAPKRSRTRRARASTRRVTIDTASRLTRMLASSRISETLETEILPSSFLQAGRDRSGVDRKKIEALQNDVSPNVVPSLHLPRPRRAPLARPSVAHGEGFREAHQDACPEARRPERRVRRFRRARLARIRRRKR